MNPYMLCSIPSISRAIFHARESHHMVAKIIHFGPDDCHRLLVLQSTGYAVEHCNSLFHLRMNDSEGVPPREVVAVARERSALSVVLFRDTNLAYEESGFDLVVDCLTSPEVWLREVEALIERRGAELRT